MTYDAYRLERHIGNLLGIDTSSRSSLCDADRFRAGNPKDLAKIVSSIGKAIKKKGASVDAQSEDFKEFEHIAKSLDNIAEVMKKRTASEPEDYHWLIVGYLCEALTKAFQQIDQ